MYISALSFSGRIHGLFVGRSRLIDVVLVREIGFEFQNGYRDVLNATWYSVIPGLDSIWANALTANGYGVCSGSIDLPRVKER